MIKTNDLDFGKTDVKILYRKFLYPTILGMISTIIVIITDGFFIGKFIGSDALAAVNIASPLFDLVSGFGIMAGLGCSIISAVYISRGKQILANVLFTQITVFSVILFIIVSFVLCLNADAIALLLGSSPKLLSLSSTYITLLSVSFPFFLLNNIGLFMIRLDRSPKYAMSCTMSGAVFNIIGDFFMVGVYDMGVKGVAIATSVSFFINSIMVLIYILFKSNDLKLCKISIDLKGIKYSLKNIYRMCKIGFSGMLNQLSIALMALTGNYIFMKYLHEDGVAAFSVLCYYFPIVFMINNAIAQSAQPIISYNLGGNKMDRVKQAFHLSLRVALGFGIFTTLLMIFAAKLMTGLFLTEDVLAFQYAIDGMPYFAIGFIFFALNIVYVGYLQSVGKDMKSNIITIVRGYVLLLIFFIFLPRIMGNRGIWLAMPLAEGLTTLLILLSEIVGKAGKRYVFFN